MLWIFLIHRPFITLKLPRKKRKKVFRVKPKEECPLNLLNAILVSSNESTKEGRGEKNLLLSLTINSAESECSGIFLFVCRSASSRDIWHEVKLVLSKPELWQLVGSVQAQLDHQRHENFLIHGVKVNNSTRSGALACHADPHTHAPTAEGSRGPQERVGHAQRWAAETLLSSAGCRMTAGDPWGEVLVVRVELLQLHAGYEVWARLQAERLRFGERRRRQRDPRRRGGTRRRGEGHYRGLGGRVVEKGGERRRWRGEVLHRSAGVARAQDWGHHQENPEPARGRGRMETCHQTGARGRDKLVIWTIPLISGDITEDRHCYQWAISKRSFSCLDEQIINLNRKTSSLYRSEMYMLIVTFNVFCASSKPICNALQGPLAAAHFQP